MYPEELKYAKTHEWIHVEGNHAKIGITSHAISELGELTYLEITVEPGTIINKEEIFGEVESVKTTSELYSPVSGKVIAVNSDLSDNLDDMSDDAYQCWMIEIELTSPDEVDDLMDSDAYSEHVE